MKTKRKPKLKARPRVMLWAVIVGDRIQADTVRGHRNGAIGAYNDRYAGWNVYQVQAEKGIARLAKVLVSEVGAAKRRGKR